MKREFTIAMHTAQAFALKEGARITLDQNLGPQLSVLVAFNQNDKTEYFSQGNTRLSLAIGPHRRENTDGRIPYSVQKGDILVSNKWNKMLLVEDDTFNNHDIIFDPCDVLLNSRIMGQPERYLGCRELHSSALESFGIKCDDISNGINLFQNTRYKENGISVLPTSTRSVDYVVFQTLTDLIVSISACPFPLGESKPVHGDILYA